MKKQRLIGCRRSESGFSGGELLAAAAVLTVVSYGFFIVWDWIGATVDKRVEDAKKRNIGRTVEAKEHVVDLDQEGGYVITFRTG